MAQSNLYVSYVQVSNKLLLTVDHQGPTSYVNGTGETIFASDLGVGGFEFCDLENISPDGTKYVNLVPTGQGNGNSNSQFQLWWFACAAATQGAQIANTTNLNGFTVRLQLICV